MGPTARLSRDAPWYHPKRTMALSSNSLERLVPDRIEAEGATGRETLAMHLERYEFAAGHAGTGRLLDCACGVGYGTRLLADRRPEVEALGVDIDPEAVAYAAERYGGERVRFQCTDGAALADPDGFETIVSLETIEHVPDPAAFLRGLVGMLRPGGVFVGSVPTTPSVDVNPHHLHDFTEGSFLKLLAPFGLEVAGRLPQVQRVDPVAVLRRTEARMDTARENLAGYYLGHPGALAKRLFATLRYGFSNHYLTVAWRKPS